MTEPVHQVRHVRAGRRLLPGVFGFILLVVLAIAGLYLTVPAGSVGSGPVDALVVLGTPADVQGQLTDSQRWRVDEAIREFHAGQAPRIVLSGGPAANQYVEADVMAAYAEQQGVPADALLRERRSTTTLQNVANTAALLKAHGWHRVEVISTAEHLPRAAILLRSTDLAWRVHAAPAPGRSLSQRLLAVSEETFGTAVLRVFGTRAEPVLHAVASVQHRIAWAFRWVFYRVEDQLRPSSARTS